MLCAITSTRLLSSSSSWSHHRRDVPSFPTRRSSDLTLTKADSLGRILQSCAEAMVRHLDPALARIWILDQRDKDRKSTRLNSSHGYISYAVFCLKKKKNKQQT